MQGTSLALAGSFVLGFSTTPLQAQNDTRDIILGYVNTLLQTGESSVYHTGVLQGNLSVPLGNSEVTLSFLQTQRNASRNWTFPTDLGDIHISTGFTLEQKDYGLSFPLIHSDSCDATFGGGVHEFSRPELSFSGSIGEIQGSVSEQQNTTMYDPFISATAKCDIPLSGETDIYAQVHIQEGVYTRVGNIETGIKYQISDPMTLSGGLGIDMFRVKTNDAVTQILATYLDDTTPYISGSILYTPSENFSLEAQGKYYPDNGDMTLSIGTKIEF